MAKRNMSENSLKNLEKGKDTQFKTGDEAAKECGRKGGLQLGINNQERRLLKEICEIIGEQIDEETGDSNKVAMVKAMYLKAKTGDVGAFNTLRDTMGEKPTDKQEVIGNLGIEKVFITPKEAKQTDKHIDDVINEQS